MRLVYARHRLAYPGDAKVLGMVGETFETFLAWLEGQGFTRGGEALHREIAREEMDAIREHGKLYDMVPETLRELARRGCLLTLCTNGDRRYVDAVLRRGEIADLFARLSTLEAGGRTKSERVGDLARAYAPRLPVVVGDRFHDVEAARANGCRMVAAAYGYSRDGELEGADATIATFAELPTALERLTA